MVIGYEVLTGTACVAKGANIYKTFDEAVAACNKDTLCEGFHDNCGLERAYATCSPPIETLDPGKDCNTILYRKGRHYVHWLTQEIPSLSFSCLNQFQCTYLV